MTLVASVSDYSRLILIGEPGSGWRATFDIIPGGRVLVGRPNHATRNMSSVAYLPSRAVSRMHAIISMEADGVSRPLALDPRLLCSQESQVF